ncbi:MAG TPA: hypothetical protein VGF63_00425 [Solirubrobacteraceae bacterium]|jgi:hypothetical protein
MTTTEDDCVFPQLEQLLADASHRRVAGAVASRMPARPRVARWRSSTRRSSLIVALVATLTAGTALAARPWEPLLGNERQGHPTTTDEPVDATDLALLHVLRRPQTDDDRGPGAQLALATIGDQNHGVRLTAVRHLSQTADGRAIVLIPEARFADDAAAPDRATELDVLCVDYPAVATAGHEPFAGYPCWTTRELVSGRAVGRLMSAGRQHIIGLAPDGVSTVTIELANGERLTAGVADNFFDVAAPDGTPPFFDVRALRWRGADGAPVGPPAKSP